MYQNTLARNLLSYNDTWNTRHPVQPNTSAHRQSLQNLFTSMSNSEQKNSMKIFALSEISRLSTTTEECRRKKTSLQIFCKQKHWRMFRLAMMWYLNRENTWKMVWKIAQSFSKRNESDWNDGRAPALNLAIIRPLINNALNKHFAKIKKSTKPRFNNFLTSQKVSSTTYEYPLQLWYSPSPFGTPFLDKYKKTTTSFLQYYFKLQTQEVML